MNNNRSKEMSSFPIFMNKFQHKGVLICKSDNEMNEK